MPDRNGFPAGVPCFIDLSPPDPEAATRFYGPLFGWTFEDRMPPEAPGHFFAARLDGREVAAISSAPTDAPPMWTTYVAVDSADDVARRIEQAGGTLLAGPFDVFDAGRMAVCADPQGAGFCLWQPGRHTGVEVANAPGSWNWSDLKTHDTDAAKAFYGDVFGWESTDLDFGGGAAATMWRRPGYGDVLAERDPDIRTRQAEAGAPAGFEDAIGWIEPVGDGAPRWRVTFSVADADDVAARTLQLGGKVLIEPHNVPYVRAALLEDPQGAVFVIGEFRPDQR